jgi:hypothetical protein
MQEQTDWILTDEVETRLESLLREPIRPEHYARVRKCQTLLALEWLESILSFPVGKGDVDSRERN